MTSRDYHGLQDVVRGTVTPGRHQSVNVPTPQGAYAGVARVLGIRVSQVTDGLSQTVFLSERVVGDRDVDRYTPSRDIAILASGVPDAHLPDGLAQACRSTPSNPADTYSYAGGTWLLSSNRLTSYNHILTPNSSIPDCETAGHVAVTARSQHPHGVHTLLGDGSVRFEPPSKR